jgi:predicted RNA-binding protein with PUA-like domain
MRYWLMKSEPSVFSIDDLKAAKSTLWDSIRNYQARNFMMNDMKIGDQVLFYHSNAEPPGVAGVAEVVGLAEPDPTQFDKKSDYFDPKATRNKPIWFCVRLGFKSEFSELIPLEDIRTKKELADMLLLRKGQRLSIQPVTEKEFKCICQLATRK